MANEKTLTQMLIEAENAKKELNAAILSDKFSEVESAKKILDKAIKDYNTEAIILDYQTLRASSTPMLSAIEKLNIAIHEVKQNKDNNMITYSIEPAKKQISLSSFDEFCRREKINIAHDPLWEHKITKFCLLITYKIMKDLDLDTRKLEETYYIKHEVAQKIDMGKTPTSNTQILKQLQSIVDSIIYEEDNGKNVYKVKSHDVEYIVKTMTRRGKESGTVISPRPSTMQMLIMDMLHRIITDGEYKTEYITKNQAKKAKENILKGINEISENDEFWIIDGISYNKTHFKTLEDAKKDHILDFVK